MTEKDDLARNIGGKLRELRKAAGLTLKRLAEATEFSAPLLSRIENGQAMPSIPTLQTIAHSLKVDVGYFFREEANRGYVVLRQGNRSTSYSERGSQGKVTYEVESLTEGFENPFMEPIIATLLARSDDELDPVRHGGQELLYVIEGKMLLTLGDKKYVLSKGDNAYYDGNTPHKGISLSQKPARTLNVHLIPGSRVGIFSSGD
jgi:transcriptional regulator with XRE-family HTH domain